MSADTIELQRILASDRPSVRDVLQREGTRAVLLAGSQDPNAKMTVVLIDEYGPSFVVKIPTTRAAETVILNEGHALDALARLPLGSLSATLPRPVGFMSHEGRSALVSTALVGTPMTVAYHGWHHTARRRNVRRDFAAAGVWLGDLQTRTAGSRSQVSLFGDSVERISSRFAGNSRLAIVKRVLNSSAGRLGSHTTPRTVVHGDFWFGNLLMQGNHVNGVVDWESCLMSGEPLRDVARFAVSYALYLDRHTRPHHRVHGHKGLRAEAWGSGVTHLLRGRGWFSAIAQNYMTLALGRLGIPTHLWRDVLVGGIADVAATADHPEFAERHFMLLSRIIPSVPTVATVRVPKPSVQQDDVKQGDGETTIRISLPGKKSSAAKGSDADTTDRVPTASAADVDDDRSTETTAFSMPRPAVSREDEAATDPDANATEEIDVDASETAGTEAKV
jgi:hypothetical protein